jgi:hypothetical protein
MDGGDKDLAIDALPSTGRAAFTSNPCEFALAVQKKDSSAYKEFYRQTLQAHATYGRPYWGNQSIQQHVLQDSL